MNLKMQVKWETLVIKNSFFSFNFQIVIHITLSLRSIVCMWYQIFQIFNFFKFSKKKSVLIIVNICFCGHVTFRIMWHMQIYRPCLIFRGKYYFLLFWCKLYSFKTLLFGNEVTCNFHDFSRPVDRCFIIFCHYFKVGDFFHKGEHKLYARCSRNWKSNYHRSLR